jgi:hypothetical protein
MSYTKVKNYTDKEILTKARKIIGFVGFPTGYFVIGIRSEEDTFDTFDDKFYIYFNPSDNFEGKIDGIQFVDVLTGTTNPGGVVLKGGFLKYNKQGAAILKSDYWHYNLWYPTYRQSRGYELRQAKNAPIYRDGNQNGKAEELGEATFSNAGINFHTNTFSAYNTVMKWLIGSWSAGCQVTNDRIKFIKYLKMFLQRSKENKQSKISYCLLQEF